MTDEQQRTLEQDIEEPAKATPPGCPKCGLCDFPDSFGFVEPLKENFFRTFNGF